MAAPRDLSAILLTTLLLAACTPVARSTSTPRATAAPSPTATPAATARPLRTPQPLPSAALPDLVLSYQRDSDIPSIHGPELLVTADGQLLSAPGWGKDLSVRRLSPSGVDLLRRTVLDTGLFTATHQIQRRALPGASPNLGRGFESLSIRVRDAARDVVVSTFARDGEDALYTWDAGRQEFLALADRLSDLSWLPESAWADRTPRPYDATFHRLYIQTTPNLTDCGGRPGTTNCLDPLVSIRVDEVWPFTVDPGRFGTMVATEPGWPATYGARCAILTAEDARILGEAISRTNGTTYHPERRTTSSKYRWPAGGGEVYLQLEPLLPQVPPTCDGVRYSP